MSKVNNGNPPGWTTLPVEVMTDGNRLVILGDTAPGPPADEPPIHSCDAMGCGTRHVLAVVPMTPTDRAQLAHLLGKK